MSDLTASIMLPADLLVDGVVLFTVPDWGRIRAVLETFPEAWAAVGDLDVSFQVLVNAKFDDDQQESDVTACPGVTSEL